MPFIYPDVIFERASAITIEYLKQKGIKALILDVDNTLTEHGSQIVPKDVLEWLSKLKKAGIKLTIASNNIEKRIKPFANRIDLKYQAFCIKPLPFGLMRACKALSVSKKEVALVGDQIFTDMFAAHFYGIPVFLVNPIHEDFVWSIKLKRFLEKPFLSIYYKKGGNVITSPQEK